MTTRVCEECGGTGFKQRKPRTEKNQTLGTLLGKAVVLAALESAKKQRGKIVYGKHRAIPCPRCNGTGRIHEGMPLPEAADWKEKL